MGKISREIELDEINDISMQIKEHGYTGRLKVQNVKSRDCRGAVIFIKAYNNEERIYNLRINRLNADYQSLKTLAKRLIEERVKFCILSLEPKIERLRNMEGKFHRLEL